MSLLDKKCISKQGTQSLNSGQIQIYLQLLHTSWKVIGQKKISREFTFKDFSGAIEFINKLALLAEAEQHHPDIFVFYNKVVIEFWTHAVNGLSENDFIMAAKIEDLK